MFSSNKKAVQFFLDYFTRKGVRPGFLCRNCNTRYVSSTSTLSKKDSASSSSPGVIQSINKVSEKKDGFSLNSFKISQEFSKFKQELRENFILNHKNFEIRHPSHTIDMLFTFERPEDVNNFSITTNEGSGRDNTFASLEITEGKTAVFSGVISSKKEANLDSSPDGYAIMMSDRKKISFGRRVRYNWEDYTHLVFKVRGDGHTYGIVLPIPEKYDITRYLQYSCPLYTRGGPYWQIAKIPFNHFYCVIVGNVHDNQMETIPLNRITRMGIFLASDTDGPFRLEIEYIGLENDLYYNEASSYESYYVGRHIFN